MFFFNVCGLSVRIASALRNMAELGKQPRACLGRDLIRGRKEKEKTMAASWAFVHGGA